MRMVLLSTAMLAVIGSLAGPARAEMGLTFEWRVKDGFRLFDQAHPEALARVEVVAEEMRTRRTAELSEFYHSYLYAVSGSAGHLSHSESLRTSNYEPAGDQAQRTSGRYASNYLYPDHYRVELRAPDLAGSDQLCTYQSRLAEVRGDCGTWTAIPVATGAEASVKQWQVREWVRIYREAEPVQEILIQFTDELIVALGDSYISGEGNPDVPSIITDQADRVFASPGWGSRLEPNRHVLREAGWWDEPCHRSLLSWPVIASFAYAARSPDRAVTLVHLGCSGAVARELYKHGEKELPGGGDEQESQLALLDRLMARRGPEWGKRRVDRLFLSIGGNDVGFVGVIKTIALPPNGYTLGPLIARAVGQRAGAICPYDDSGLPLSRLCYTRPSAQSRIEKVLPAEYAALDRALRGLDVESARIFQPTYPNALVGAGNLACDTNPNNDEGSRVSGRRPPSGFEALMGIISPSFFRGFRFSTWNFELLYQGDGGARRLYQDLPKIECDWTPDYLDSEVCQAMWVHASLNQAVRSNHTEYGWRVFDAHETKIAGHGMCNQSLAHPLEMPLVKNRRWRGRSPQSVDPYDFSSPRWFRVPNDSIVTQYAFHAGERLFHHGTAHPTYRAHIEIAQAAYDAAFREPIADETPPE